MQHDSRNGEDMLVCLEWHMMSILDTQHDEGNSVPTHYNIKNELLDQFLNTEIKNNKPMLLKLCILLFSYPVNFSLLLHT
jgi:hypothetical protein